MKREQKEHQAQQISLIHDYKDVFGTKAGERVLADLEHESSFEAAAISSVGMIDTNRLIYSEARRILILYIRAKIKYKFSKDRPTKVKEKDDG